MIDTAGLEEVTDESLQGRMRRLTERAVDMADICLFMVDARVGVTSTDEVFADILRKRAKNVFLAANKIDGLDPDIALADFYSLGFTEVHPITATQGRGVKSMLVKVLADFEQAAIDAGEDEVPSQDVEATGIKIAIAGRPNVGKSTLVNRMLGEERVVVFDEPGTTRDSIYIPYERRGRRYTLIDTAGIKKRGQTKQTVEKFSVVKSLQAIQDAHVVVLIVDARTGIVEQDLHLLGYVIETGRALVIAINKWDGMHSEDKDQVKDDIRRRFVFVDFAKIHFISALYGTGVGDLYKSIHTAYESATKVLTTHRLTELLQDAVTDHAPPMVNGRRIKLRYAHAGGHNPPIIVIHGKQTDKLPGNYSRYLEKTFRKVLKLEGTPVRIELRSGDNPFVKGEEGLTQQQISQKRRIKKNKDLGKKLGKKRV